MHMMLHHRSLLLPASQCGVEPFGSPMRALGEVGLLEVGDITLAGNPPHACDVDDF